MRIDEITEGSPYGASMIAGGDGNPASGKGCKQPCPSFYEKLDTELWIAYSHDKR
jgi:hypothetical protein